MKPKPTVAVVGRPNVGKSTLFNRITGHRRAIVHATPGVTRDIQRGDAEWTGTNFQLIDTAGLFSGVQDDMIDEVEKRALAEALNADALLFVTDGQIGPTPTDAEVAEHVRELGIPVFLVVNKAENETVRQSANEFYKLGFDNIYAVSALHGEGTGDLLDDLVAVLPRWTGGSDREELRMAIVGMPNVGKSSLVNSLVGSDANIVDSRPGTTRDSIDITVKWQGHQITLIDTAGLKRRARTTDEVSVISSVKALESIERCDVAVIMLDATRKLANQDVRVGGHVHRAGRGVLVCFNKWDLVEKEDKTYHEFELDFRHKFAYLAYAPIIFISALTHQRINKVLEASWKIHTARKHRIPTAELNKFVEELTQRYPPSTFGGGTGKIYYGTQVDVGPPTFALFVNKRRFFGRNYLRFVNNRLREAFPFDGTQIRIKLVEKKGRPVDAKGTKERPPRDTTPKSRGVKIERGKMRVKGTKKRKAKR